MCLEEKVNNNVQQSIISNRILFANILCNTYTYIRICILLYTKRNTVAVSGGNALLKIGICFVDREYTTFIYPNRSLIDLQGRLLLITLNAQLTNPYFAD